MTTQIRLGAMLAMAALLLAAPMPASAASAATQKVYRCGPDGRIYSQTPCKDGYEIDAADKRSAEQRRAAEDVVKREEKMAEKMSRERQANEAAAAKQGASTIVNPAATKPAASARAATKAASAASMKKPAATKDAGAKSVKQP